MLMCVCECVCVCVRSCMSGRAGACMRIDR